MEPNGPQVYVPPEQRDEMLRLINGNRRAAGLLPQKYPGHDPYGGTDRHDPTDLRSRVASAIGNFTFRGQKDADFARLIDVVMTAIDLPTDLPATLASVDDVRRVCEAAGLEVAHASVAEPRAWSGPNGLYVYACIDETDRPRLAETTVENGSGLVADVHHDAPASVLYGAIQAARSAS